MSKKSKEKGLSFVYDRNGEKMHCGVTSISEFRRLGNSNNPLAPQMSEVVNGVFIFGVEFPQYDGYTVKELIKVLEEIDFTSKLTRE